MPIQNTKLAMGKPQNTGLLLPQTPIPLYTVQPMSAKPTVIMPEKNMNAIHQRVPGMRPIGAAMSRSTCSCVMSPSTIGVSARNSAIVPPAVLIA